MGVFIAPFFLIIHWPLIFFFLYKLSHIPYVSHIFLLNVLIITFIYYVSLLSFFFGFYMLTSINGIHTRITGNKYCEPSHLKAFTDTIK
jgi:hypothetical protein